MINLTLSPTSCLNPRLIVRCSNKNEEPPRYRLFSVEETNELDGDIFIDDSLKLDKENFVEKYFTYISYTPSKENPKEFHVNDLSKLKKLISKAIIGDI